MHLSQVDWITVIVSFMDYPTVRLISFNESRIHVLDLFVMHINTAILYHT